jgi:purine-nucleoside/S-methyl-5'-thioadenosine phosphorylase / adenosine deaminase
MFVTHNGLTIYFGDASDSLYPCAYLALPKEKNILASKPFAQFQQLFNINQLIFLKQIHSTKGLIISHGQSAPPSFNFTGDFLITNVPTIGIGVMTADCLPIIIYDPIHHIIALIHAGWKGTINNIAPLVVTKMQKLFNTDLASIQVIFGPSAKQCCYTVQEDFVVQVKKNQLINCKKVFYRKNNALFFDLPECNQDLLEKIGIKKNAFYFTYNVCTICNNQYFSHRRQGDHAGRQMTVISFQ